MFQNRLQAYMAEWKGNFSGDLRGGIASGIIILPIALAFGQASGLGAMAGLYGAIVLSFFGSLFGGTKTQISSPVGLVLVVVTLIINSQLDISAAQLAINKEKSETLVHAVPYIFLTFFLAGLIQMSMGLLKLGYYIRYLPYPVVSGFSTGIGLLIVFLQLQSLLGFKFSGHTDFSVEFLLTSEYLHSFEMRVALAVGTLFIIFILPRVTRAVPSSLVALIIMSMIPYLLGWTQFVTVDMPEESTFGLRTDIFNSLSQGSRLLSCLGWATYLALVSSINTLLTSLAADNMTPDRHHSNLELVGQGLGNAIVALFGGMPGSGAVAGTVYNIGQGGRTRLSGLVATITLIIFLMLAGRLIGMIPKPVLDGVMLYIGYLIIDKKPFRQMMFLPLMDVIILLVVAGLTAYGELLYAVLTGLSLASIYFMKRMADVVELDTRRAKVDHLVENLIGTFENPEFFHEKVHIRNIKGPVFFGFASRFSKSMTQLNKAKVVVFNFGSVPYIDQSGLYTLEREIRKLSQQGIKVCISELNNRVNRLLRNTGLIPKLVSEDNIFPSVEQCISWLNEPGVIDGRQPDPDKVYIPTAFTPNDDGSNDSWIIKNLGRYPNCKVEVFTREGRRVFYSIGYQVPWNGKSGNDLMPIDKYRYKLNLNDQENQMLEGYVSIFR